MTDARRLSHNTRVDVATVLVLAVFVTLVWLLQPHPHTSVAPAGRAAAPPPATLMPAPRVTTPQGPHRTQPPPPARESAPATVSRRVELAAVTMVSRRTTSSRPAPLVAERSPTRPPATPLAPPAQRAPGEQPPDQPLLFLPILGAS